MTPERLPFLRTHSYFGFLDSLLSPDDLVELAARNRVSALGLTDHRHLSGAVTFYEACERAGIKPILGLEVDLTYQGGSGKLSLLAKNLNGWSNLSRLSSLLLIAEKPVNIDILNNHAQGLICIAGGPQGILRDLLLPQSSSERIHQFLGDLRSIFAEDCFIEIQRFINGPLKNEPQLLALADNQNLPIIATQNIHYAETADQAAHRTLTAIKHNCAIHALQKDLLPPGSAHFPSAEDFAFRFKDLPQALENLHRIEEHCSVELPIGQTHYPTFVTSGGESQSEHLRQKAYAGAKAIYGSITEEITERLDYELDVISGMGYEPIFLIVEDVINHARKLDIPTSSRGSAASSLVAHCLNITSPDPLALNLYFERFLNPARKKPPDIDTDIASHRRDEVIQYVFDNYGAERVAMVGTINRYRPKSALGDVAKAYGLSPETIRQLSKKLPSSFRFTHNDSNPNPFLPLMKEGAIPVIKDIVKDAAAILDIPRHLSVHPGGIVIAPFPITDLIPLTHSSSLGINHTQFDLDGIEKMGMVKIDLLGIRGLTVLGEVAERIRSWRSSEFKNALAVLDSIPNDDPDTAAVILEAKTIGCFQIESPGMRATLQEIKASNVEDIMAALALYRPGPLRGGLRDDFVRRFRGEETVQHIHPSLEDLLGNTLGVILYQEQVLRIAHEVGGLSIAQADILRRAMSHFDPGGVMETLRQNFIHGAAERRSIPRETAEHIWEMMAAFAGYGFPKAHAASYAQLAWNSAWCKTHFPAEFMAAVLGYGGGYYSQRVYLMEARRLGLTLNPPHINHSGYHFQVKYPNNEPTLYMGFNQVRDLTHRTIQKIIQKRPFHSLEDFLLRVDPQKREARHLVLCGALEGLTTIAQALERVEHRRPPGQMQLFTPSNNTDDWTVDQKISAQREILGVSLEMSPLEEHADQIQSAGAINTLAAQNLIGKIVRVAGMRQTMRRIRTRSNQMMAFMTLEDQEGSLQIIIPPLLYRRHHVTLREVGPFLVEGIIEADANRQRVQMTAQEITIL